MWCRVFEINLLAFISRPLSVAFRFIQLKVWIPPCPCVYTGSHTLHGPALPLWSITLIHQQLCLSAHRVLGDISCDWSTPHVDPKIPEIYYQSIFVPKIRPQISAFTWILVPNVQNLEHSGIHEKRKVAPAVSFTSKKNNLDSVFDTPNIKVNKFVTFCISELEHQTWICFLLSVVDLVGTAPVMCYTPWWSPWVIISHHNGSNNTNLCLSCFAFTFSHSWLWFMPS